MKILLVTSSFPNIKNTISGNFILDQINNLQAYYDNVKFVVCAPGIFINAKQSNIKIKVYNFRYFFPKKYEKIGIESLTDLIKNNKIYYIVVLFYTINQFFKLFFITLKEKPDLIYAHWFTTQAITSFIVSKLFKIPFKITIHSTDLLIFKYYFGKIGIYIAKIILKSSSGVSVTSKQVFDSLYSVLNTTEINNLKILQYPMGIDSIGIENAEKNLEILKLLDHDTNFILYLGRLVEKKGLEELIKGFGIFNNNSGYKLIIAGFGNLEKKLRNLVEENNLINNVIFTGKVGVPEKKTLFENSEILIVPSNNTEGLPISEGMPVTILEGLYFGKLVIASKKTNCDDVIKDGSNGFIFENNGETSIAKVLEKVSKLDTKDKYNIINNALKTSKLYNSKGSAKKYYEFLIN